MTEKGFSVVLVLILILVVFAVVGFGFYFYQDTTTNECHICEPYISPRPLQITDSSPKADQTISDETVNWKTYTSQDLGFQFKYPQNWSYSLDNSNNYAVMTLGDLTDTNHIGQKVSPTPTDRVALEIRPIAPGQTIEQIKNLSAEVQPKWEDIVINGLDAKKVDHMACLSGQCRDIIFSNDKWMFDFMIENSDNPEYQKNLQDITSTFKFLN